MPDRKALAGFLKGMNACELEYVNSFPNHRGADSTFEIKESGLTHTAY